MVVVYFFWPETARLSLEEVAKNFGDEVAGHIHNAKAEDTKQLDEAVKAFATPEDPQIVRSDV
jgi:hypothetical protein